MKYLQTASTELGSIACTITFLALMFCVDSVFAADIYDARTIQGAQQPTVDIKSKKWQFIVAPYVLAPTISGDAKTGRLPNTNLDVSPGTIFENLQFGAMGHVEVLYDGRFGATLDVAYMDLGKGRTFPAIGGSAEAGVKQMTTEAFFGYRFWRQNKNWAEAYIGGRWWFNELSVTSAAPGFSFSRTLTEQWIDPVVGLRGQLFLADEWSLYGSVNIGGFGLVSDFTWGLQGGVGYHLNESVSLQFQYKAIGVDYDNSGSGTSAFEYDTVTHGPMLGLALKY